MASMEVTTHGQASAQGSFSYVPTRCLLCGSNEYTERYVIERFKQGTLHYVTCLECGTAYQNPMPDQESMRLFYHSEEFFSSKTSREHLVGYCDYDADEQVRQRNAAYRLKELEALFPPKKTISLLKIACGYGTFVKAASDRGHLAEGIDFSEVMVNGAKDRYGVDLIHADFLDHDFRDKRYDAVLLYGAINNFLRPIDVAKKAFDLLKPGGFYLVNHMWLNGVPERIQRKNYWIYRPPIVGIYPKAEFRRRHQALGFRLYKTRYEIQYVSFEKLFGFLHSKSLLSMVESLRLHKRVFRTILPGYEKVFLQKPL